MSNTQWETIYEGNTLSIHKIRGPTGELRFIKRDGEKILQQFVYYSENMVVTESKWEDVPLVEEEKC